MEVQTLQGFLLRKIFLANDDAVLEFFTYEFGKITVFASKLAKSKKKICELDFFRLLEISVIPSRTGNFKLRNINTQKVYSVFSSNYETLSIGFKMNENLLKMLPEEKPYPEFFHFWVQILSVWDFRQNLQFFCFFRLKSLQISGLLPRFDVLRGDVYLELISLSFSEQKTSESIFIKNEDRQLIEFLRRISLEEFLEKISVLPLENFQNIGSVLAEIEKYHS